MCSGTVAEVIQSVVNGADGCIFCFGQANLGKGRENSLRLVFATRHSQRAWFGSAHSGEWRNLRLEQEQRVVRGVWVRAAK